MNIQISIPQKNLFKSFILQEPDEIRELFLLEICDKLRPYFGNVNDPIGCMQVGIALWQSFPMESFAGKEFHDLMIKSCLRIDSETVPEEVKIFYQYLTGKCLNS